MPISGTMMFLKTDRYEQNEQNGFTLLELLVVLLIMGATLALSIGTWKGRDSLLDSESKRLLYIIRRAKGEAMLTGRDVRLELKGTEIFKIDGGQEIRVAAFPAGFGIVHEAAGSPAARTGRILFAGTGVSTECLLRLYADREAATIHIPAVGSIVLEKGEYSLNDFLRGEQ